LFLGIIGVLSGFFYTASPVKLGYKGWGELVVGLCFGPLVVLGSYYVQAVSFSTTVLLASVPVGILILLVLYINEFPDYQADKSVNKKTLVVILGKAKALKIYHFLLGLVYFYLVICVLFKIFPWPVLVVLITLPSALKAYRVSRENFQNVNELLPANALTISLHLIIGSLLSLGFILDKIF
jgi:1,4-dihydroxy-2-naphthoate octaprenyltransferase